MSTFTLLMSESIDEYKDDQLRVKTRFLVVVSDQ